MTDALRAILARNHDAAGCRYIHGRTAITYAESPCYCTCSYCQPPVPEWVRRAQSGTLPASDRTAGR